MFVKRLPLKGVHNLRDLGGYPAGFHNATKWKLFFRADGLFELEAEDIRRIMSYCKIKTVIDLRGSKELKERPNNFQDLEGVNYENVPLISEKGDYQRILQDWQTLDGGYISVAKNGKEEIREVFRIIANAMPNPVLYHCTAGKDRTGIISCLLLGACGVDEYDIISDYEVSCTYIKRDLVKMVDPGSQLNMDYVASPPGVISGFLSYVNEAHGSITGFLRDCGVEDEKINLIKRNFLVDIM